MSNGWIGLRKGRAREPRWASVALSLGKVYCCRNRVVFHHPSTRQTRSWMPAPKWSLEYSWFWRDATIRMLDPWLSWWLVLVERSDQLSQSLPIYPWQVNCIDYLRWQPKAWSIGLAKIWNLLDFHESDRNCPFSQTSPSYAALLFFALASKSSWCPFQSVYASAGS